MSAISTIARPILGGTLTEECLHMLAANAGGNCCVCVRFRLERICFDALSGEIDLDDLPNLARQMGRLLTQLRNEFGWPFGTITSGGDEPPTVQGYRFQRKEDLPDMMISAVRHRWLNGLSKTGSVCNNMCGPGSCEDWVILCAYQDALRTHLVEWIDSISLLSAGRMQQGPWGPEIHPLLFDASPTMVLSDLWALEFIAIVLKSPQVESLVCSLRTAVEAWLGGGDQQHWTALLTKDWQKYCSWWRDHEHTFGQFS